MSVGSLDSTAASIASGIEAGWPDSDLVRLLVEAIHEFEHRDDPLQQRDFLNEPRHTGDTGWDAALAALAVHLVRAAGFERVPSWTLGADRYSPTFRWIGLAPDSELNAFVFQRTPVYFKARGVMIDEANLVSV